jgi:predicted alpha/beta hydrolase family esterase
MTVYMSKKVFIVHGWGGNTEEAWFPWLKKELEARGIAADVLAMPNSEEPTIREWTEFLAQSVGSPDESVVFVGHSIGCQTILRYLEKLPSNIKIGGAIFVAGWFTLHNLETEEEQEIAKPWLETPIDCEKVKQHCDKFVAILSDNDSWVDLEENRKIFVEKLGAQIIVEPGKGHFNEESSVFELPVALESILNIIC